MPRYELSDGSSHKFWTIELAGSSFSTTYGKIGSAGQTTLKEFPSDAKARTEHDKLVAEKTKKGYVLVATGAPAAAPPSPKPPSSTPKPVATPPATPPETPPEPRVAPGEPRLVWTDAATKALKKDLAELAVAPLVADNALGDWKVFIHAPFVDKPKGEIQTSAGRDKASEPLLRDVLKVYGSLVTMPKTLDVETAATMMKLASAMDWKVSDAHTAVHHLLVFWAAHSGLPFALEVFAATLTDTTAHAVYGHTIKIAPPSSGFRGLHDLFQQRADRVLQGLWLGASEEARAATRTTAQELRAKGTLVVRSAIASALLDREWIDEDLAAHAKTGERAIFSTAALVAASSPQDVAEYLRALPPEEIYFHAGAPSRWATRTKNGHATIHGYPYVERFGLAGIDVVHAIIERVLAREEQSDYTGSCLQMGLEVARLAHESPPAVAAALSVIEKLDAIKLGKESDPKPAAYDALKASPTIALPLLRESKRGWAKNLVPQLERLAGGTDEQRPEADVSALPAVFATKFPRAPEFWLPQAFPRIALRDGTLYPTALNDGLGAALKAGDPAAIEELRRIAEPASLATFAWDLFQAWLTTGAPAKDKWAFTALGLLGSDETARRITPLVRAWPGESQHARAVLGLEVLSAIGSDVALMMLNGIAQKLKFKGLQEKAREKMNEIAAKRGMTAEQLSDRLVPDLDLEDDGSRTLDFGPRSFRVGFDETLAPFVMDATGTRLKDLPKPNSKDDAGLAAAATETWKAMKKDARALAAIQILRLELAMGNARRWSAEEFQAFFVEHPLLTHLVRRLVWGVYEGDALVKTFRVAEDRTYADASDETTEVTKAAQVGIVHRLHLSDADAAAWGRVFADYELAQPFEQLARAVYRLEADEGKVSSLVRFKGRVVETRKLLGLLSRGWRKGSPEDAGNIFELSRTIRPDLHAVLVFSLGINAGGMEYVDPTQTLENLDFGSQSYVGYGSRTDAVHLSSIDPVILSEVIRDIESMPAVEAAS